MVGGDAAAVAVARPVFETFAGVISHLGGVGAAAEPFLERIART
jgi:3-hydroxyisobutyrate dehydrogenase-like beta-hydroxyacid dehydrogenase